MGRLVSLECYINLCLLSFVCRALQQTSNSHSFVYASSVLGRNKESSGDPRILEYQVENAVLVLWLHGITFSKGYGRVKIQSTSSILARIRESIFQKAFAVLAFGFT